jgi:hypothetical protein
VSEALFPLGDDEEVLLLRPDEARWREQLARRPSGAGSSGQYDDRDYAARWYERFGTWPARFPVRLLEVPFDPAFVGLVARPRVR